MPIPSLIPERPSVTVVTPPEAPPPPRRGVARQLGLLSALGVLAATVLTVCTNILAARFYTRWDVTSSGLYTLSPPSLETLHGLSEDIEVIVFLSQSDPQVGAVLRLLAQYEAESKLIRVRHVDPDRNPAEFIALRNRYRLSEGRAEEGRLVNDAALVIARGDARWVITSDDIVAYDDEQGTVRPELERAVTEGLRQVLHPKPTEVCFSSGHQEPSMEDGGSNGLGALRYMLQKNNYATREVDLTSVSSELGLTSCDLVIVAAPAEALVPSAAERLLALSRRGQALLIAAGPALDEEHRGLSSGLEPVLAPFHVRPRGQLVFERDPEVALPVGLGGEAFLASPKAHAITQGLLKGGEPRYRVLMQLTQAFEATGPAAPLLGTSDKAFAIGDATALANPGLGIEDVERVAEGPFVVAMAAELEPAPSSQERGARLVVLGSASPLLGGTWEDPTLAGTRRFVESALSWLVSRPTLVSLPEKPERQVALGFTEQSLSEVVRYVLLYMPGTALLLGLLVLYRRRWRPTTSRRERGEKGA